MSWQLPPNCGRYNHRYSRSVRMAFSVLAASLFGCTEQPAHAVPVKVIYIRAGMSRFNSDMISVGVQAENGATARKSVVNYRLSCKVGDTLKGSMRGVTLTLKAGECERPWLLAPPNRVTTLPVERGS